MEQGKEEFDNELSLFQRKKRKKQKQSVHTLGKQTTGIYSCYWQNYN